jgi:phosphoglucosamine mutase
MAIEKNMQGEKLFGTDGIRGIANIAPMTADIALQVGRGIAYIAKYENKRHRVLIGKDTRLSGYMIESALTAGICSLGVDILLVGPLPTPGIAFMTVSMRADAGVVISASHNPFQDNGIKIFDRYGYKLSDELEDSIEELVYSGSFVSSLSPTAQEIGKAYRIEDAAGRYIMFLKNTFPKHLTLEGLKIVLDCANGAAYKIGPAVFEELGADVICLGITPNGENINAGCGSLYPEVVSQTVKETGANIGIALDGDADRVIIVDEHGNEVDGDHVMAICAKYMVEQESLRKKTLVATIMSNMGLEKAVEPLGVTVLRTKVGDRYVVEELQKGGYNFGGEKSGHLIFLDHNTTGDGMLTALKLLSVMLQREKPLSDLSEVMKPFPQVMYNVKVREKCDPYQIPEIADEIRKVAVELKDRGRIVVRPSGTEPKIRVMVEGEHEERIEKLCGGVAETIRRRLGD